MRSRFTTPVRLKKYAVNTALVLTAAVMSFTLPMQLSEQIVKARNFDAEINAKRQEIAEYQNKAAELRQQANTFANELARLGAEKATIQGQIDLSQAKHDQLVADIATNEKKIADGQDALGDTIADLYVDDDISALEMVASSKSISEYVDKQAFRTAVRDSLTQTISKIRTLKKELEVQKQDVARVLDDQKNQRASLAAKEGEQQQLLAQTNGEEAAYQRLSSQRTAEVDQLRAQQAALLASRARSVGGNYLSLPGDGSRGGYPSLWANSAMNAYVDDWGMYSRQCVSYAAFKVDQAYGNMPYWGGIGNANEWDDNARRAGIPTGSYPKPGAVGVVNSGTYGHVAWVESVNSNGTINISHYNINWNGDYAEWKNLDPSYFDTYIYFGG